MSQQPHWQGHNKQCYFVVRTFLSAAVRISFPEHWFICQILGPAHLCVGLCTRHAQCQHHPEHPPRPKKQQEFDGGPCCMQFGCMVQRGYYPSKDERLRGTFVVSPAQDVLPAFFVDTSDPAAAANVRRFRTVFSTSSTFQLHYCTCCTNNTFSACLFAVHLNYRTKIIFLFFFLVGH